MIYRPAMPSDCLKITEMWRKLMEIENLVGRKANKEECEKFTVYIINMMMSSNAIVTVMEEEGEVVGFSMASVVIYTCGASNVLVGGLAYIEPEHRNGTHFRKMMKAGIEWGKSRGCKLVEVTCREDLVPLYKKMGFSETVRTMGMEI